MVEHLNRLFERQSDSGMNLNVNKYDSDWFGGGSENVQIKIQ